MAAARRIAVIGTSGSGKTTLSRRIGAALGVPIVELDAINWQAGWRDLNTHDPEMFQTLVARAVLAEDWVSDGNYSKNALPLIVAHATDIVWLDYSKHLVMARVIRRSLRRALFKGELWPGTQNVERFSDWLDPTHPIRWAWTTHAHYRTEFGALTQSMGGDIAIHQLRHPNDTETLIKTLATPARP